MYSDLEKRIFNVNQNDFDALALEVFSFQAQENPLYRNYLKLLNKRTQDIQQISQIPFLPVSFFKSHAVLCGVEIPELYFESSGTTGSINSKHYICNTSLYEESFSRCFELFYGDISEWCILGLLPSYLERNNSSLVYMTDHLIKHSKDNRSGFFLHDHAALKDRLIQLEKDNQKTLLIGVTYALLNFAEANTMQLKHTVLMETGGMKGRKKEITRTEVHDILKQRLGIAEVHSEYGMTELLSQAYSKKDGIFQCPPWMKILARAEDDPFDIQLASSRPLNGVTNIIDLANLYSCSFIATDDIVKLYPDGNFEISGRLDNVDIRGCSLLSVN